jgi:thymidylate synthase
MLMAGVDFGNPASSVAITTFWTDRTKLLPKLDKASYSILGNLYSSNGINYLLQTLLRNTHITTLVLFGYSLTKSDEDLLSLWENGVVDGRIKGTKVSVLIEPNYVDLVRMNVKLVDLRKRTIQDLVKKLDELKNEGQIEAHTEGVSNGDGLRKPVRVGTTEFRSTNAPYSPPIDVKFFEEEKVETIPSPLSGHYLYETSVFAAWVKLLHYVMRFGELKMTEYDEEQKEYNNIMVTIAKPLDVLEMQFKELYSDEELQKYYEEDILNLVKPEEKGISYTYGDRLFNFHGINQVDFIVEKLGKHPYSRRAVAVLWEPGKDEEDEHGPCLNMLSCNIHGDEVYMSVVFRSNDTYGAWFKNVMALMKLQNYIVGKINEKFQTTYTPGKFTITSISAHIYRHDFKSALDTVEKHFDHVSRLVLDPKGLFVIRIAENQEKANGETKNKELEVEYRSNEGELLEVFRGKSGEELYRSIASHEIFSFFVHSAYLGYQIAKAEHCMKQGIPYIQDRAPER